jgi:tRNA pseudouridine65 synthase
MHSNTDIEILYQSERLIAVYKPHNLLVHKHKFERGNNPNLLRLVRNRVGKYVYPINRLDNATSGIVLFGLDPEIVKLIQPFWNTKAVEKKYLTLCKGIVPEHGTFDFDLSDKNKVKKPAITHYKKIAEFKMSSLCEVQIETGRNHQIRRHFSRRMHHILGDKKTWSSLC